MLKSVKRVSALALVAVTAFSFLPAVTSASEVKQDVAVKVLGEANVLNLVKVGGECDKIYVQLRTKELNKIVDVSKLKISLKYDIYHDVKLDALKGKIVANGEVTTKQKGDFYEIVYDPTANPNGPAGNYALKVYLQIGKYKSKIPVIVRVKINEPCKADNNGGANNGGTDNGGADNGNANAGTNNGGADNGNANAGTNNGGADNGNANAGNGNANAGTDNGSANAGNGNANAGTNAGTNAGVGNAGKNPNGGKLPKTATNSANAVAFGAALALAGAGVLAYRRRETN